jgi:hypothetical protein
MMRCRFLYAVTLLLLWVVTVTVTFATVAAEGACVQLWGCGAVGLWGRDEADRVLSLSVSLCLCL